MCVRGGNCRRSESEYQNCRRRHRGEYLTIGTLYNIHPLPPV